MSAVFTFNLCGSVHPLGRWGIPIEWRWYETEAKQAHLQVQPCGILVQDGEGSLVGDLERGTVQGDEVFAAGVGI